MGPWYRFECPESRKRWRYDDRGFIEVEGEGFITTDWPAEVNRWKSLIDAAAVKYSIPAAWIASTMAQETGGRNICLDAQNPSRVCGPPCNCLQNEGAGVMAMLPSTATVLAGRRVTSNDLLNDPALAVDLGAKLIRGNLDRNGGEFVHAALSYNAGSVRCGRGSTFVPAGQNWPKEPCPNTGWGVVMGCVYTAQKYGSRCQPSTTGVKPFVCSTDYPRRAIESQNAAREHFEGATLPSTPPPVHVAGLGAGASVAYVAAGAVLGYALMNLWADA